MERHKRNKRVLLLHGGTIMHYRVPIYNYFSSRFRDIGIDFSVAGSAIQSDSPSPVDFHFYEIHMSFGAWLQVVRAVRPDAVILFSGLRHLFILPFVWILRTMNIRVIYWGHGIDLSNKQAHRWLYSFLHYSCHAIILYAEHLRKYIDKKHWYKVFIANNTLCLYNLPSLLSQSERLSILASHNISTAKNIIFTGRMQKHKRILDLLEAAKTIKKKDIGVILVGPNTDNIMPKQLPTEVTYIRALYGEELLKLMMACDIYCCPGAVGLNIVDAMACSLPFVTEDVEYHGPEIMYLKNGENGIVVPKGRSDLLASALMMLLNDDELRHKMAECAKDTYNREASIEQMYQSFIKSVRYVFSLNGNR
jgi:1,2-diacylglycerol 3-alpha-glucosyltransferase